MKIQLLSILTLALIPTFINAQHAVANNQRMNVIYIGVENPIEVAVANYSAEAIEVKVSNGEINGSDGKYIWTVQRPGRVTITVSVNGKELGKQYYHAKRIPDPIVKIGSMTSNQMSAGELKTQKGIRVELENFYFDAGCKILSFSMVFVRKNADVFEVNNQGSKFNDKAQKRINEVKAGDIIYIENIKCRCFGDDIVSRKLNSIVVRIK